MKSIKIKLNNSHEKLKDRIWINELTVHQGINILFGGNGAGKSTIINLLQSKTHQKIVEDFSDVQIGTDVDVFLDDARFEGECLVYSNSINNVDRKVFEKTPETLYDIIRLYQSTFWSEGMCVSVSAYDFLYKLEHKTEGSFLVLLDEIDSGLDALSCRLLINKLFEIVEKQTKCNFYILLSFNQYEIARACKEHFEKLNIQANWINVYTGKEESIAKSYEEYYNKLESEKKSHRRLGDEGAWGADESEWYDISAKKYNKEKDLGVS